MMLITRSGDKMATRKSYSKIVIQRTHIQMQELVGFIIANLFTMFSLSNFAHLSRMR